jgi:hypothetical protein
MDEVHPSGRTAGALDSSSRERGQLEKDALKYSTGSKVAVAFETTLLALGCVAITAGWIYLLVDGVLWRVDAVVG